MKVLAITSLVVAALGASSAMAQSQPLTRDEVRADLTQARSSGALERTDHNYGTWWADNPSSPNYSQSYSTGPAISDTGMASSSPMSYDSSSMGAAGRSYDGSTSGGPASRADVAADRDSALRSGRWIFNDLDGVQRLEPGWNSHAGHVYMGPADSY
ncbi:DUF4148 domain-containing protein [uncultured Azohydromonas sp.]|uniref:DUF4148 domain-containing protein n=1 Tax=uncultured Azohydromonas sp. TaxID=487342 RepID=UPI00262CA14D|nr:DUF4148 domain-containing protein [uncultured Azohydromonas sp.]